MIDDRDSMFDMWKEWHKSYLKTKKELAIKGLIVNNIGMDLKTLEK